MDSSRAGIAIVGGGLIGMSIAWRLSQAGAQVTVFDAGIVGGEANSAGAGMLSPGGEFDSPSNWFQLGIESMRLYADFVSELRSETNVPIDFRICGCLVPVSAEAERALARSRIDFHRGAGIRVHWTSDGLFYPDDGLVDPNHVLHALRSACEARRITILENHPVGEMESSDYAAVVIAAGAWAGQIQIRHKSQPVALPRTIAVKGHLLGFALEPDVLGPMRRHGHTYVLQRSNGLTIAGSTEEQVGFHRTLDPAVCADIHHRAVQLFPILKNETPAKAWFGFRPYCPDLAGPQIGRIPETNIWTAYGHYRNGILLAPLTAQQVVRDILSTR